MESILILSSRVMHCLWPRKLITLEPAGPHGEEVEVSEDANKRVG